MIEYISINRFIEAQQGGQIFCKISKSPNFAGKGSHVDYKKIEGKFLCDNIGNMTFGPLEAMLHYLHYGDRLTIIEFNKCDKEELKNTQITNNIMNRYCYDTNKYKVGKSMSLKKKETYDYIFNNIKNINLMEKTLNESYNTIISKINEYKSNEKVEKYFKQKVHKFMQKEFIPENLCEVFDTRYISKLILFKLFDALEKKKINFYIKDRNMEIYSIIDKHKNGNIIQELLIDINRNYTRKFFVNNKELKKANIIKNNILKPNISNRLIYRFL